MVRKRLWETEEWRSGEMARGLLGQRRGLTGI